MNQKPKFPGINRKDFTNKSSDLSVKINDVELRDKLTSREFSTGSYGWFASQEDKIKIDDKDVDCMISINVVVKNSKYA